MASRRIKHKDNATCIVCKQPIYPSARGEGVTFHYTKKKGRDPVYIHTRCLKTQGDSASEEGNNEKAT